MAANRKRSRTAPLRHRTGARRQRSAPKRPQAGTIALWAGFALVGLLIAASAALLAEDVPFEDRKLRALRRRLRERTSLASADAIDGLSRQLLGLRNDVRQRLADLR